MKNSRVLLSFAAAALCALLSASPAQSAEKEKPTPEQQRAQVTKEVHATIAKYKKDDPGIERFFKHSAGYAVFPRVGKVGLILGGGNGLGNVYERGRFIGTASISFLSVGLQAGAQEFSEIIFFKDRAALQRFKENKFEFAANASAVIVKTGASSGVDYRELSVGTQKFSFTPKGQKSK
jgi:lipid-binding SYLF domain-containing protein